AGMAEEAAWHGPLRTGAARLERPPRQASWGGLRGGFPPAPGAQLPAGQPAGAGAGDAVGSKGREEARSASEGKSPPGFTHSLQSPGVSVSSNLQNPFTPSALEVLEDAPDSAGLPVRLAPGRKRPRRPRPQGRQETQSRGGVLPRHHRQHE